MNKIIALAIILGITNCSMQFMNASSENGVKNDSSNSLKIELNEDFQSMMKIDTIGDVLVQFDLNTEITYFTSIECEDCLYFGDQKATRFTCLKELSCVQQGAFESFSDVQISQDYFASGDIIDVRMVLGDVHFYLPEVYLVKSLYTKNQNPSKYVYQKIGLLLAGDNSQKFESQIFTSLYKQGKIDKISYSLYYDENVKNYYLTIPDYDSRLIPSRISLFNLTLSWNAVFDYKKEQYFTGQLDFCGEQMLKQIILNIHLDPTVNDQVFQLDESYFEDFNRFMIEHRMEPDLSLFTKEKPGEWSTDKNFSIDIKIDIDQNGKLPKPKQFDVQFSKDDVINSLQEKEFLADICTTYTKMIMDSIRLLQPPQNKNNPQDKKNNIIEKTKLNNYTLAPQQQNLISNQLSEKQYYYHVIQF
ncbi:hypothetical protein TTHERM_00102670 (macronuclear) [Tetrahymena thermophila SB210]|uniref:Transmembrane protein n=1 Tax=Tetrahymena thermophila (strain SB210) TaxID=312017 RepID=Q234N1_TETTS|nr:hypothetical protein TTHERM_00102670 [Tetrahymena thermophila SB210]EAR91972.2 hypothetical protein TTHERM_00102670 [Tetrahymena thermophila SB210]|eukprot:XP_001012217.2 hypothetical protein TTHERM_00102670 [Tetrahymena thermophila SB210]